MDRRMGAHARLVGLLVVRPSLGAAKAVGRPAATHGTARTSGAQQGSWRGLTVPNFPRATSLSVWAEDDECDLNFQSRDSLQREFNFYRDYLTRQGFRVRDSEAEDGGQELKANLVRGRGGPDDTFELDVRRKNGQYKVGIDG